MPERLVVGEPRRRRHRNAGALWPCGPREGGDGARFTAVAIAATLVVLLEEEASWRSSLASMAERVTCARDARSRAPTATAMAHWASWAVPSLRDSWIADVMWQPLPKPEKREEWSISVREAKARWHPLVAG